jgi:hypothetical protein
MGFASHLGPWLLGTVNDTTGTTAGTIRNMGATIVAQQAAVTYADTAASQAFVLPAGASITAADFFVTTGVTSGSTATLTLYVNGTSIGSTNLTASTTGKQSLSIGTSNPTLVTNVGSTDAIITYTFGTITAGAGMLQMNYVVRNSDGAANPASA